jgi:hypothetical protein
MNIEELRTVTRHSSLVTILLFSHLIKNDTYVKN